MPADRPRVLLKISGEALCDPGDRASYSVAAISAIADEIASCVESGVEVALVIGAGNVFRGAELRGGPVVRATADNMGMLGTVMNALALRDVLGARDLGAEVLTGLRAPEVAETFTRERAVAVLDAGHVLLLAGGTGHPYFTTDTAAVLRALQVGAGRLLKATKVDGVYSADPETDPDAVRYDEITFQQCLEQSLEVMDQTAFALCRDNGLPVVVFDMRVPGAIRAAAVGEDVGTRVIPGPASA